MQKEKRSRRWLVMALLAVAEVLAMSLWFSASAVVPVLKISWHLSESAAAWLTLAVQFGFVVGTLVSALANLPDVMNARRLFAFAAVGASASNALFALIAQGAASAIVLRFLTGMFLAGVYPPAMKIIATWFRSARGTALGILIGALTLGKAFPYLMNAIGHPSWQVNMIAISVLCLLSAVIVLFLVSDGPYTPPLALFDAAQVKKILANRGVRLADLGYFGHMWELYAMWTWTPVMIRAQFCGDWNFTAEGGAHFLHHHWGRRYWLCDCRCSCGSNGTDHCRLGCHDPERFLLRPGWFFIWRQCTSSNITAFRLGSHGGR